VSPARKVEVLVLGIFSSGAYVFSRVCDRRPGFLVGPQDLANRIMLKIKIDINNIQSMAAKERLKKREREKRTQFVPFS
jgi:hypothetical protein